MKTRLLFKCVGFFSVALTSSTWAAVNISFSQPVGTVETYDYIEVIATVDKPDVRNPFFDASLSGTFAKADGSDRRNIEGFCDSTNGSLFRVRFMPSSPGNYSYSVIYRQ